jgi:hypothetical protein
MMLSKSDEENNSEILKNLEDAEIAVISGLKNKPRDHDIAYLLICISKFKKMVLNSNKSYK